MNVDTDKERYVHRHYEVLDDDLYIYDLNFSITEDRSIVFSNIRIHSVATDADGKYSLKSRVCKAINDDPHIITKGMHDDGIRIMKQDGLISND